MRYFLLLLLILFSSADGKTQINLYYDPVSGPVFHGIKIFEETLIKQGKTVSFNTGKKEDSNSITIRIISDTADFFKVSDLFPSFTPAGIRKEGFRILKSESRRIIVVAAGEPVGAMYGLYELTDHIRDHDDLLAIPPGLHNPEMEYRIIKFNLPWSPYRDGPATQIHRQVCRDLDFWKDFLDMMAGNRFNVLSLWNLHPFTFMIRPVNFPAATPFSDQELKEWQAFWKSLFSMAKARGIQTFIVNWNIVVSPEFAEAYGAGQYNDRSALVKRYTRESVTQVINEYEDLTGIGVTLADWMNNFEGSMSSKEREDWILDTFIEGMNHAGRKVKFLHRSVLSGSPLEMRRVLDQANLKEPALVEVKFNWSHGHSTTDLAITHDYHSGKVDDRFWNPRPENYNIQWMIRNEDFFILRWGVPDFIREHLAVNNHNFVNGYFIGSEGYIPALDYSHRTNAEKTWQYGFEKQWLFYRLWGRLLYDPETPDDLFEHDFDSRYGSGKGKDMLKAYSLASKMTLRLAAFYRSTWDYTLYSEGFLAPRRSGTDTYFDGSSDFISIDELIFHETLDPDFISIVDYVKMLMENGTIPDEKITPPELALALNEDGQEALDIINGLDQKPETRFTSLQSELDDIATWSYLSLYFSEKITAGVALQIFRETGDVSEKRKAVQHLEKALAFWKQVIVKTEDRYRPVPHVSIQDDAGDYKAFSWAFFLPQVVHDIEIAESARYENK